MIRSRSEPKRRRRAPLSLVESTPPTVARLGQRGSSARRCPCSARVSRNCFMVQPASTVIVRSDQACSRTALRRAVERTMSARCGGLPQASFVPPPRGITFRLASFASFNILASSCSVAGSIRRVGCTADSAVACVRGHRLKSVLLEWSTALICSGPTMARAASSNVAATCGEREETRESIVRSAPRCPRFPAGGRRTCRVFLRTGAA